MYDKIIPEFGKPQGITHYLDIIKSLKSNIKKAERKCEFDRVDELKLKLKKFKEQHYDKSNF